ncbi:MULTISPECIES: type IV pilin protein [Pseudidiomarina]|uniref:Type IV pilus assembly protein PilE n=2 Tax=Pseudidiomarina TaxID=2800384 RepID=A0A368V3K1_9GAMM|nr:MULTISPECIES: type IV pilin protein [Pseudidiomarina]PWW16203.1 type IV pilus assembly protein PilE [Pseudidiomarina maritima]RBP93287.1 type IV pilus assembly protein PilE [Pseudidiomarina tainanensis]RCW35747.1 type IV pilus assembly protein PilE [Pseudidiomarina tainanensis]
MQVKKTLAGITLIELMIVVAILGILGSIAYPNYVDYVRASRRADAITELLKLQLAQEEYRLRNSSYASIADLGANPSSEFYSFSASNIGAETYTLTATATGAQALDTDCAAMSIDQNDAKTPADCWR